MIHTPIYEELKRTLDTDVGAAPAVAAVEVSADAAPVEPVESAGVTATDDPAAEASWTAPSS